jgi:hypothetical protein
MYEARKRGLDVDCLAQVLFAFSLPPLRSRGELGKGSQLSPSQLSVANFNSLTTPLHHRFKYRSGNPARGHSNDTNVPPIDSVA